jgi:hypothetical protein
MLICINGCLFLLDSKLFHLPVNALIAVEASSAVEEEDSDFVCNSIEIGNEESDHEGHVITDDHITIRHSGHTVRNQSSLPIPNAFSAH